MDDVQALLAGHPVILGILAAGGLALVLIPVVVYLLDRRPRR